MKEKLRLGVVVSGSGSNLQALIDACAADDFPAQVVVVVSNVPGAFALERAKKAGIPTEVRDHKTFANRDDFDRALVEVLRAHRVEWVCHAGFMRLVGKEYLAAFPGRVLNIHPALLPSFSGLHAVRQALAYGVKIAGCTVHVVDEGVDAGPIVAQAAVPVLDGDDEKSLAARILEQEHQLYPLAVRLIAEGKVAVDGRQIRTQAPPSANGLALRNPGRTF